MSDREYEDRYGDHVGYCWKHKRKILNDDCEYCDEDTRYLRMMEEYPND